MELKHNFCYSARKLHSALFILAQNWNFFFYSIEMIMKKIMKWRVIDIEDCWLPTSTIFGGTDASRVLQITDGSSVDFWSAFSFHIYFPPSAPAHTPSPPPHHLFHSLSPSVPLCQSPCSRALEIFQTYLGNQSYSKLKENIECHWAISMKPVRGRAESWACGELGLTVSQ